MPTNLECSRELNNKRGIWADTTMTTEISRLKKLEEYGFPHIDPLELYRELSKHYKRYTVKQMFMRASNTGKTIGVTKYADFMKDNPTAFRGVYQKKLRSLSQENIEKLLELAENSYPSYVYNALLLTAYAGMRMQETVNLKWDDYSTENQTWYVACSKGYKDRHVPFPLELFARLKHVGDAPVSFLHRKVRHLLPHKIRQLSAESGIKFSMHDLRAFCLSYLSSKLSASELMDMAGHASFYTTMRYINMRKEDVLNKIKSIFLGGSNDKSNGSRKGTNTRRTSRKDRNREGEAS